MGRIVDALSWFCMGDVQFSHQCEGPRRRFVDVFQERHPSDLMKAAAGGHAECSAAAARDHVGEITSPIKAALAAPRYSSDCGCRRLRRAYAPCNARRRGTQLGFAGENSSTLDRSEFAFDLDEARHVCIVSRALSS